MEAADQRQLAPVLFQERRTGVRRWTRLCGAGLALAGAGTVFHPVIVQGESMTPTLRNGQCIWVDYTRYYRTRPQQGDVVVLRTRGQTLVKRVYRGPGETFHCVTNDGDIIRPIRLGCAQALRRRYLRQPSAVRVWKVRVPDDAVFVIGDNVEHSEDSRSLGHIPIREIIGRAWLRPDMTHLAAGEAVLPPPVLRRPLPRIALGDE